MSKNKCKLIGYRRVSTQRQGMAGLGMEAQDNAINAHVVATGCVLVATYTEVESGKRSDRPELARAIAHARRIGATLVIAKLDRLARNVHFLSGLMEAGVAFVACDMPNANNFTLHIMAAVAEQEANMISVRTRAALTVAKARGTVLGGKRDGQHTLTGDDRAKGGRLAAETKRAQARDKYADLVPTMEELKAAGSSLKAIADRLNADGHRTSTGAAWGPVQVMRAMGRAK